MTDDQPTHSGDLKHADSNHAVLNDLRNNQLILRPGEKIIHTFTKSNPHAWFSYFEKLCIRYKILSDDEKLHACCLHVCVWWAHFLIWLWNPQIIYLFPFSSFSFH